MSEQVQAVETAGAPAVVAEAIQSPPAAPMKVAADDGPRLRLHQVAQALSRGLNRQLLAEYLQLRRAVRH
ncbi:MAG TPA: hypothetical protein VGG19_07270 [Tepidisphaeraceae bacterium]